MEMLSKKLYFPFLLLLLSIISVAPFCSVHYANMLIITGLELAILVYLFFNIKRNSYLKKYRAVYFFLIWAFIGEIRGVFEADNYWDWKNLMGCSMSMLLPLSIYYFDIPNNFIHVFRYWIKYIIPLFFIIFLWIISPGAVHYFVSPFMIFICFIPILSKKWKIICLIVASLMLFRDIGARSQMLTAMASLGFAMVLWMFRNGWQKIVMKYLKIAFWGFHVLPVILLFLGISGTFNIFECLSESSLSNEKTYNVSADGNINESNVAADTRTFIYVDVINSALKNNYVLFGRTMARGNDCTYNFGDETFLLTGRYERFANEVGMTNIFTWLGMVGLLLYIGIYFRASWLGIYRSNNIYIKILSCFVAYHCMYGWIENYPAFTIHTLTLYVMIAMCMSSSFRSMTNLEFEILIKKIFK